VRDDRGEELCYDGPVGESGGVMARVMVVFGGRSEEHEVSLASARAITRALEEGGRHEVVRVGITRSGRWVHSGDPMRELEGGHKPLRDGGSKLEVSGPQSAAEEKLPAGLGSVDVVFPILHGPYGEDGTIQGMLELAGVPYVGSGVLGSAVGMDKITMKKIFAHHGLPQVEWTGLTRKEWESDPEAKVEEIEASLGYPCFVKPANLGSSVGIEKAEDAEGLRVALGAAAGLDRRIIVEKGVDAREIEVSVLGNEDPEVSVPGEILLRGDGFYDYEAKYVEGGMELGVPAKIPDETAEEIRRTARTAFEAIDAAGMARVDFFLERNTGRLLINEINTIPGFTPTSVYAELWAASGLLYGDLIERLIELALERHG
jgi:D-alanine-D-alanine ligase